jgi:DNA-nicking Smr family endonuclease
VRRKRPPRRSGVKDPEAEALAQLDALVAGEADFDLSWSDEHVEGLARGVNRRILRALRKGVVSQRMHLDLHGLTRKEARPELERFFHEARRRGERCVLVIHGRGLNSEDGIPVLKDALSSWLTRGRIARSVLAFCSARPTDGGLGAVYILLRK